MDEERLTQDIDIEPPSAWGGDHVGKLVKLRACIEDLMGSGKISARLEEATFGIVLLRDNEVPPRFKNAFRRVVEARLKCRVQYSPSHTVFDFQKLTPTERKGVIKDILSMYEACLIDIGRGWPMWDFMYPSGLSAGKPKRVRRTRKKSI